MRDIFEDIFENQPLDPIRMGDGIERDQQPTPRVAEQAHLLQLEMLA